MRIPRRNPFGGTNGLDNSSSTMIPRHTRDPLDGKIHGIKHGPCRACGKRKIISTASLLCGTESCLNRRIRRNRLRAVKS